MKAKKMLSTFCVACMLLSILVVPGSAAETRADYAGTTMRCMVVDMDDDSAQPYDIYVPIPADATSDEQARLVNAAAMAAVEPTNRSVRGGYDKISSDGSFDIASGWDWDVGGGKLNNTYKRAIIQFVGITPSAGATTLTVTIRSDKSPGAKQEDTIGVNEYPANVVFVSGKVTMAVNSTLSVTATTDRGGARIDTCTVWGDPYG